MTRAEAKQKIQDILAEATETESAVCYVTSVCADALELAIEALEQTERKTGEWVGIREYCDYLKSLDGKMYVPSGIGIPMKYCNLCWESAERGTNYCPNCGAKMGVEDDE